MSETIATLSDLERMKSEIIQALREVRHSSATTEKKWLRSQDVRRILGVSSSTLQTMRIKREIPFSKISGIIYYPAEGLQNLLNRNLRNSK